MRLALLYEAINAAAELPLPDFLELLCQRLADALGFRRVAVWGVDEERGAAVRLATVGPPLSDLPETLPLGEVPALVRFLREGEAIVADAPTFGPVPAPLRDVSALFAAPLRVGGQALGALFGDCAGEPFELNPEQIALARGVAAHAALALELARLRDKAQG
jgi:GAF domain-containing protein